MPPWVARQWHVLRRSHAAVSSPAYRYVPSQRIARPRALRFFSHQFKSLDPAPFHSGIVIPPYNVDLKLDDLVKPIEPVREQSIPEDHFAVFLVTRTFAHLLRDDDPSTQNAFTQNALSRLYQWSEAAKLPDLRIRVLCAVVDKLPIPQPFDSPQTLEEAVVRRSIEPPTYEAGYEGLAYTLLPASSSVLSLSPVSPEKGAISFLVEGQSADYGHYSDTLQLPLANTIFQTGLPTTMTLSTWDRLAGAPEITCISKRNISHHSIRMNWPRMGRNCVSTLAVPLIPLTFPRQVDASMGNILRRVIGPDGKSVAASQELEQVVPRYFKSRNEPSQPTSVWALITPKNLTNNVYSRTRTLVESTPTIKEAKRTVSETELWDQFWKIDPPTWNRIVPIALASGARLHRVLSGGGGWGKKAGLLSLDPLAMNEETEVTSELDDTSHFDGLADLSSALQHVIDNGDSIQFFISSTQPKSSEGLEGLRKLKERAMSPVKYNWHWELGTIPSTADAIEPTAGQGYSQKALRPFVFRGSFGALTEAGITISRRYQPPSMDQPSSVQITMVDVPFSRFSATNLAFRHADFQKAYRERQPFRSLPSSSVIRARGCEIYEHPAPPLLKLPRRQQVKRKGDLVRQVVTLPPLELYHALEKGDLQRERRLEREAIAQFRKETREIRKTRVAQIRRKRETSRQKRMGQKALLDNVSSWLAGGKDGV